MKRTNPPAMGRMAKRYSNETIAQTSKSAPEPCNGAGRAPTQNNSSYRRDNDNGDVKTSYEMMRRRNVLAREIIRAVEALK